MLLLKDTSTANPSRSGGFEKWFLCKAAGIKFPIHLHTSRPTSGEKRAWAVAGVTKYFVISAVWVLVILESVPSNSIQRPSLKAVSLEKLTVKSRAGLHFGIRNILHMVAGLSRLPHLLLWEQNLQTLWTTSREHFSAILSQCVQSAEIWQWVLKYLVSKQYLPKLKSICYFG